MPTPSTSVAIAWAAERNRSTKVIAHRHVAVQRAPDAQRLGDAPGLGDAADRQVRRVALEDLGHAAQAGITQMVLDWPEQRPARPRDRRARGSAPRRTAPSSQVQTGPW